MRVHAEGALRPQALRQGVPSVGAQPEAAPPADGPVCSVCLGSGWDEIDPAVSGYRLFECRRCRCCLIDADRAPLHELYEGYYAGDSAQRLSGIFQVLWRLLRRKKARLIMGGLPAGAQVCDVGCERGELLHVLKQAGCRVVGTQLSESASRFARERFGIEVHVGELAQAPFAEGSFDAILMIHVLEHLPQPEAYVSQIRRLLKPGGVLWIEVPNAGCWTGTGSWSSRCTISASSTGPWAACSRG